MTNVQRAYLAYCKARNWVNTLGDPLEPYEKLNREMVDAWEATANALSPFAEEKKLLSNAKEELTKMVDELSSPEELMEAGTALMAQAIHSTAKEKGWWQEKRNFGEAIALIHSELSEALEADRQNLTSAEHIPQFSGVEEELADVVIRVFDLGEGFELDLVGAILAKMRYNQTRPYKHGKKF